MRILVLSFYFRPDLSAGSFRTTALVSALCDQAPPGAEIDVVTTAPNRYQTFSQDASAIETVGRLTIRRIKLPSHRSDIVGQSRAFIQYARSAIQVASQFEYDLVFATSSRLMTATLGAYIARRKGARLYLDIRDIFADTIKDLLPSALGWLAEKLFSRVEAWTMQPADRINLVSKGFEDYFKSRYPDRRFALFTNGIDDEFLAPSRRSNSSSKEGPITILYAGNIGEGQGLHKIIPGLAVALRGRARFVVIGDGGRRSALQEALRSAGANNVEVCTPMSRPQLLEAYGAADVLFLHLGAHEAFEKVLPSKLFEYAAIGKPILAGVTGYAAKFIREEIANAAVFPPCDVQEGVAALAKIEIVDTHRSEFIAKYSRANIVRAMAEDILSLQKSRG
jgi:glycosyltransferase involved in cell wall biosynthesis